ncbi:MAG: NADP-dependent oxidoreductase, partial [Mucilaginibacter sp.]
RMRSFLTLPMTLGWDAAGTVEAVGSEVTAFRKGDAVYGVPNFPGNGSYAEYCAAKAKQFAFKPQSLSFNEAAGVPLAALTAWTGMFWHGKLQAGQRIFIQGASGGVGSFAVQFAKAMGAYVIGMASTSNLEHLKQLGADEVIDYKTQNFEEILTNVDVVLEASPTRNNDERIKALGVLKERGIFVSVNTDFPFNEQMTEAAAAKKVSAELAVNQPRQDWLTEIAQLIDDGQVKVLISKVYPLEQVAEAHRESETWHVRGKLVLEIKKEA